MTAQRAIGLMLGTTLCLVSLTACNLFTQFHPEGDGSDANVLVADGQAALSRGDNKLAAQYFAKAIDLAPTSSRARVGYAQAYLKARGFNLANVVKTIMDQTQGGGTLTGNFLTPSDWGCASFSELTTVLAILVNALDPIAAGQCDGVIPMTDLNVNLNAGLLLVFKTASRIQEVPSYSVQSIAKSSTSWAALGITQVQFDALPDPFWWVVGGPTPTELSGWRSDLHLGITRMRTAAAASSNPKMINDLISSFSSLETQIP